MPNNHSSSTNPSNVAVNEDFDMMINGLIKVESAASKPATRPIGKLTIHPTQQSSLALGTYDKQHAPKGFCVEIDPDPNPDHSVVTRILSTGSMREYTAPVDVRGGSHVAMAQVPAVCKMDCKRVYSAWHSPALQ
jgi:hypothetical protein